MYQEGSEETVEHAPPEPPSTSPIGTSERRKKQTLNHKLASIGLNVDRMNKTLVTGGRTLIANVRIVADALEELSRQNEGISLHNDRFQSEFKAINAALARIEKAPSDELVTELRAVNAAVERLSGQGLLDQLNDVKSVMSELKLGDEALITQVDTIVPAIETAINNQLAHFNSSGQGQANDIASIKSTTMHLENQNTRLIDIITGIDSAMSTLTEQNSNIPNLERQVHDTLESQRNLTSQNVALTEAVKGQATMLQLSKSELAEHSEKQTNTINKLIEGFSILNQNTDGLVANMDKSLVQLLGQRAGTREDLQFAMNGIYDKIDERHHELTIRSEALQNALITISNQQSVILEKIGTVEKDLKNSIEEILGQIKSKFDQMNGELSNHRREFLNLHETLELQIKDVSTRTELAIRNIELSSRESLISTSLDKITSQLASLSLTMDRGAVAPIRRSISANTGTSHHESEAQATSYSALGSDADPEISVGSTGSSQQRTKRRRSESVNQTTDLNADLIQDPAELDKINRHEMMDRYLNAYRAIDSQIPSEHSNPKSKPTLEEKRAILREAIKRYKGKGRSQ